MNSLNHIKIPVDQIVEKFDCPICMCKMLEPYMTKCGHTFCHNCISETVNIKHICPLCMNPTQKEDIFRNFALESMIKMIEEKRQEEQKNYFENLSKVSVPDLMK